MDASQSIRFVLWLGLAFSAIAFVAFLVSLKRGGLQRDSAKANGLALLSLGLLSLGGQLEESALSVLGSALVLIVGVLVVRRLLTATRGLEQ